MNGSKAEEFGAGASGAWTAHTRGPQSGNGRFTDRPFPDRPFSDRPFSGRPFTDCPPSGGAFPGGVHPDRRAPDRAIIAFADTDGGFCRSAGTLLHDWFDCPITLMDDGAAALRHIHTELCHLLVCGADLPPGGGLELVRQIRQRERPCDQPLPLVLAAAKPTQSLVLAARAAGATAVLSKPVSPASLWRTVSRVLTQSGLVVSTRPQSRRGEAVWTGPAPV